MKYVFIFAIHRFLVKELGWSLGYINRVRHVYNCITQLAVASWVNDMMKCASVCPSACFSLKLLG